MSGVAPVALVLGRARLRGAGASLATLALAQTLAVAWAAWYVAETFLASAPISLPRAPLPPATFLAAWIVSLVLVLVAAPLLGARAARDAWRVVDPTAALPISPAARVLAAAFPASLALAIVTAATSPVYVVLYELGAFTLGDLPRPLAAHAAVVLAGPLVGAIARQAVGRGGTAS